MDPNDTPTNPETTGNTPSPTNPVGNIGPTGTSKHARTGNPRGSARAAVVVFLATLVAAAIIGIPAGYIWALVAPRALAQVVSHGAANVVNAETSAFIVADAWFVLIAAIGGLLTGIAGYRYAVLRRGAPAAVGLILGGLGAAAIMWWIGDNYGHASFQHALLTKPAGTYLHASLSLGSKGAVVFWPMLVALVIAVPEAIAYLRGNRAAAVRNVDDAAAHGARSVD